MKKCPMCGIEIDDKAEKCPECGCPIADTSGFSLKNKIDNPNKKVANPMGKTISNGSGLTEFLRGGENTATLGGSMPISLSRTQIEGDYSVRRKKKFGKAIFKLVLLLALIFAVVFIIKQTFGKDKAKSYNMAIDYFIEAINDDNLDKMIAIMPPYISDSKNRAKSILNNFSTIHINSYSKKDFTELKKDDIDSLQDAIKVNTSKTARIKEAYSMTIEFDVTVDGDGEKFANGTNTTIRTYMEFININDKWYLQVDSYDNIDYN